MPGCHECYGSNRKGRLTVPLRLGPNERRESLRKAENILIGIVQRYGCDSKYIGLSPVAENAFTRKSRTKGFSVLKDLDGELGSALPTSGWRNN